MKPVAGECLKGKIYKLEYGREGFLINLGYTILNVQVVRVQLLRLLMGGDIGCVAFGSTEIILDCSMKRIGSKI